MSQELDKEEPDAVYSDAPLDLRPDLSFYGIDEVDRGVCEDTYENRSILRAYKQQWQIIFNSDGEASGNIEVLSSAMKSARSTASIESKKLILEDERNPNSDYLTEEALLIEEASDSLVPLWVIGATRTWIRVREARATTNPRAMPLLAGPPVRCRKIKSDGIRCMLWSVNRTTDDGLCKTHLGSRHNNIVGAVAQARTRAYQAAPAAIQMLEELMESAESEPIKLKAATEILDRAGVRGGVEIDAKVEVSAQPAAEMVLQRLKKLAPQALETTNDGLVEIEEVIATEETDETQQ